MIFLLRLANGTDLEYVEAESFAAATELPETRKRLAQVGEGLDLCDEHGNLLATSWSVAGSHGFTPLAFDAPDTSVSNVCAIDEIEA